MTEQAQVSRNFSFDYEDESIIEGRGTGDLSRRDLATTRLERCLNVFRDLPAGAKLLEVGCGAGRQARSVKRLRPELDVYGCDLSRRAIAEARSYDDGVTYEVADANRLPYDDNTFEAVMLFDVLEHVPDVATVVREVVRVLKPGGQFHAFIPIEGQPGTLFYRLSNSRRLPIHRWKMERIGHIQQLTDSDIMALYMHVGLRPSEKSYSFHLAGQIHDIADYWRRDRLANPTLSGWRKRMIALTARLIFYPTWRLAYYEDKWRASLNRATGMHLTATKVVPPTQHNPTSPQDN